MNFDGKCQCGHKSSDHCSMGSLPNACWVDGCNCTDYHHTENMMKTGIEIIDEEQKRQRSEEGYTPAHDDKHTDGSMAIAAACYAIPPHAREYDADGDPMYPSWPWNTCSYKPKRDRIRELARAGALIASEIDRLQRQQAKGGGK